MAKAEREAPAAGPNHTSATKDGLTVATKPLCLEGPDAKTKWWEPYYDPKTIFYHERALFSS